MSTTASERRLSGNDDPVVFMESEAMYGMKGEVPEEEYLIPLGVSDTKRAGDAVSMLCWSKTVFTCLKAAELLAAEGIEAEVIDLRSLRPLDEKAVLRWARRANELRPGVGGFLNTLGVALYRVGKLEEALVTLRKSLKRNSACGKAR